MSSEQNKARKKQQRYDEDTKLSSPNRAPVVKPSPSIMEPINLSLSNEQDKDKAVETSGLTDTQFCTTHKTLASVIGSTVANTLKYPNLEIHDLVQQFSIYFEALGWKTEDYITTSAGACLLMTNDLVPDENVVDMISPEIILTLDRIAQFTASVRRQKLYLSKSTTFNEMLDYHASNRKSN